MSKLLSLHLNGLIGNALPLLHKAKEIIDANGYPEDQVKFRQIVEYLEKFMKRL